MRIVFLEAIPLGFSPDLIRYNAVYKGFYTEFGNLHARTLRDANVVIGSIITENLSFDLS